MTMNNKVTKHLAKAAQANGICTPWLNELKSLDDKDALVDMYIRGIDFCLEHDYPSNDFIRENFKGVMEKHGVFLDDAIALQNQSKCIALGTTNGKVTATGYSVSEVVRQCLNSFVDYFDKNGCIILPLSVVPTRELELLRHSKRAGRAKRP